ncbi:unnamed protein product [Arabidopsis thaliana]|uniref:(thale cress) hypothetical protein n=1 Tax=Arabidopsis thaliana TaxID=3702 RepID=A0A7G2DRM2_ARATH|nr:unnamed protein product [Arabidopsis thaliana]
MNSFTSDVAKPRRPTSCDLLSFKVLAQITEAETHRLTPTIRTRSTRLTQLTEIATQLTTALFTTTLLPALAPPRQKLRLRHRRKILNHNSTGTRTNIVPENTRVIDRWRYRNSLLRVDTTHSQNFAPPRQQHMCTGTIS